MVQENQQAPDVNDRYSAQKVTQGIIMHGIVVGALICSGCQAVGKLGIVNDEKVVLPAGHMLQSSNARVTRNFVEDGSVQEALLPVGHGALLMGHLLYSPEEPTLSVPQNQEASIPIELIDNGKTGGLDGIRGIGVQKV